MAVLKSYEIINISISNETLNHFGAYSPSVVAIILTFLYGGRKALTYFLKRGILFKFDIKLYFYMFVLMPGILVCSYFFTKIIWNINYDLPLMESILKNPLLIFVVFFYILFLGGPLGEEFGWRGFALNRLLSIYNPFTSSIILGIIWSIWHLPLFFIKDSAQQNINFAGYVIFTTLITILITILFLKTKGSVFAAIIFHTTSNLSLGFFPIFNTLHGGVSILFFLLLVTSIITILNKDIMFNKQEINYLHN
jgi:membrane protease YdiL (CAAX protease family)